MTADTKLNLLPLEITLKPTFEKKNYNDLHKFKIEIRLFVKYTFWS